MASTPKDGRHKRRYKQPAPVIAQQRAANFHARLKRHPGKGFHRGIQPLASIPRSDMCALLRSSGGITCILGCERKIWVGKRSHSGVELPAIGRAFPTKTKWRQKRGPGSASAVRFAWKAAVWDFAPRYCEHLPYGRTVARQLLARYCRNGGETFAGGNGDQRATLDICEEVLSYILSLQIRALRFRGGARDRGRGNRVVPVHGDVGDLASVYSFNENRYDDLGSAGCPMSVDELARIGRAAM